jgi:arginase family enzyme
VADAGDVEMFSGDAERSVRELQAAVHAVTAAGAIPLILGGDHTITWPDAAGVAQHIGHGRVSMIHFDAHADTGDIEFGSLIGHGQPMRRLIESGALRGDRFLQIGLRGYWPEPQTLAWMARQGMRSYEMTEIEARGLEECLAEASAIAMDECDGVFLSVDIDVCDPGHCPCSGWTWWRCPRRMTTPRSPSSSPTGSHWRRCPASPAAARTPATAPRGTAVSRCSMTVRHNQAATCRSGRTPRS